MSALNTSLPEIAADDPQLISRIDQTRARAAHELVPYSIVCGWLVVGGILWVLHSRLPWEPLIVWAGFRVLVGGVRFLHSFQRLKRELPDDDGMAVYRLLAVLDGLVWGMLGWWITPITHLDVAVITISVLIAVASLGTLMLHVDLVSSGLFISPILLPNSVFVLTRQDDLGLFCALGICGLFALLMIEVRRSNVRITELLRLRFLNEQVLQAQHQALSQARALSETRSRFVATMSHEMRTPLHGILGLVRLLRSREVDARARRQLDLIHQSGDHLVNVVNGVLDFSAMEAGRLPLHEQPFDLAALLNEVTDLARVTANEKGLEVELHVDIGLSPHVRGDPIRLRQILHNLLNNALKFTVRGGIELRAIREADGARVRLDVQDSGGGIGPRDLPHIFDAFHQAEGTYRRRFGGTGLGLTISRELCRAMGGDLTCTSEVNQGSVFTCVLPLPPSRQSTLSQASPPEQGREGGLSAHVLLVEDNPVNAIVAEAELQRRGLKVTLVDNGYDALAWLLSQRPDLVLMDCEMPGMDGFEVTQRVRERERELGLSPVPIVALTANGFDTYVQRCVGAGMDDHLAKPFRPEDLARVLQRHLQQAVCAA